MMPSLSIKALYSSDDFKSLELELILYYVTQQKMQTQPLPSPRVQATVFVARISVASYAL